MRKNPLFLLILFLVAASVMLASSITYDVSVNTLSIAGTAGSLEFQFNPGPIASQSASLQILNFSSDGLLAGSPALSGDVSGLLPGTLTFDNLTSFNDYFDGFTFGSTLSFSVSLFGPALSSPDGTSTSGSTFAFSMFSDPGGTLPPLPSDTVTGFAFLANVDLAGLTNITNSSSQTGIVPEQSAVPEPAGFGLAAA